MCCLLCFPIILYLRYLKIQIKNKIIHLHKIYENMFSKIFYITFSTTTTSTKLKIMDR